MFYKFAACSLIQNFLCQLEGTRELGTFKAHFQGSSFVPGREEVAASVPQVSLPDILSRFDIDAVQCGKVFCPFTCIWDSCLLTSSHLSHIHIYKHHYCKDMFFNMNFLLSLFIF